MANRLHKVIFSYINCLKSTFSVIMWRSLYQTDGTVVLKCFQFRPSLVAVCFVGLFTGRSVGYNNVADRVVYNCDSILLFEERHLGKRRITSRCEFMHEKGCRGKLSTSVIRIIKISQSKQRNITVRVQKPLVLLPFKHFACSKAKPGSGTLLYYDIVLCAPLEVNMLQDIRNGFCYNRYQTRQCEI